MKRFHLPATGSLNWWRVLGGVLLLAIPLFLEGCLYFRPQYFRPESRHFDWHWVGITYAVQFLALFAVQRLNSWTRLDARGRRAAVLTLVANLMCINQWAVADQGVNGWDVLGR